MLRVFEETGGAGVGAAHLIGRFQSVGPAQVVVENQSPGDLVVYFVDEGASKVVQLDTDTPVAAEDTGYTGAGATDFTGESLDAPPVAPRSVVLTPAGAGEACSDTKGDGHLYLADGTNVGNVNYLTGALSLHYPNAKKPTGKVNADYVTRVGGDVVPGGQKSFTLPVVFGLVSVYAAGSKGGKVKVSAVTRW